MSRYFDQDLPELEALEPGEQREVQERPLVRFRSGNTYSGQWLGNQRRAMFLEREALWPDMGVIGANRLQNEALFKVFHGISQIF